MRYGLTVPNFGECFDARLLAEMAHEAEDAGWDGFFVWDHVQFMPTPTVDPWVALTAIALATRHIRLGPLVMPIPRPYRKDRPAGVSVLDLSGRQHTRWGGDSNGIQFAAPHGIAVDSRGNLYVVEVREAAGADRSEWRKALRKLARLT